MVSVTRIGRPAPPPVPPGIADPRGQPRCGLRCGRVHRCVHECVSAQYQRTSAHAEPPSGSMAVAGRWVPHSQHACVPVAAGAAEPPAWRSSAPSDVADVVVIVNPPPAPAIRAIGNAWQPIARRRGRRQAARIPEQRAEGGDGGGMPRQAPADHRHHQEGENYCRDAGCHRSSRRQRAVGQLMSVTPDGRVERGGLASSGVSGNEVTSTAALADAEQSARHPGRPGRR